MMTGERVTKQMSPPCGRHTGSPQCQLWVTSGKGKPSSRSERHIQTSILVVMFYVALPELEWLVVFLPRAGAVGYGYFVGFANWLNLTPPCAGCDVNSLSARRLTSPPPPDCVEILADQP